MFLKKEKPEFEIRPLYSIREELELIKEFCWKPKLATGKICTEEEIDAVEQRVSAGGGHGKNPSGMTEELSPFYIGCSLPKKLDELWKVRQRMEEWLVPISSKAELLRVEKSGKNVGPEDYVVYVYTDPEKTLLILSFSAQQKYGLITKEPVPYSFAEQVEEKTGMLFWSWNGQGRKQVEDKEREMQEAGLFKR